MFTRYWKTTGLHHVQKSLCRNAATTEKTKDVSNDSMRGLQFTRCRVGDPALSQLLNPIRHRNTRGGVENKRIIVEGRRFIQEALECQLQLRALVFSKMEQLRALDFSVTQQAMAVFKVPHHDLKIWSVLTQSPGLLGIFDRPSNSSISLVHAGALPITVVCDNIREPSNLGGIIRTCAAIPCTQVALMRGCCDPWAAKVLRGGCGAHFRIPIVYDVSWEDLCTQVSPLSNCRVFLAENNVTKLANSHCSIQNVDNLRCDEDAGGAHNFVIIGGESYGVSGEAYNFLKLSGAKSTCCVHIPLANDIDSLNVTAALTLILFQLRKCLSVQSDVTCK